MRRRGTKEAPVVEIERKSLFKICRDCLFYSQIPGYGQCRKDSPAEIMNYKKGYDYKNFDGWPKKDDSDDCDFWKRNDSWR